MEIKYLNYVLENHFDSTFYKEYVKRRSFYRKNISRTDAFVCKDVFDERIKSLKEQSLKLLLSGKLSDETKKSMKNIFIYSKEIIKKIKKYENKIMSFLQNDEDFEETEELIIDMDCLLEVLCCELQNINKEKAAIKLKEYFCYAYSYL